MQSFWKNERRIIFVLPIVNDETRAGERALNLKLGEGWSGAGPCE